MDRLSRIILPAVLLCALLAPAACRRAQPVARNEPPAATREAVPVEPTAVAEPTAAPEPTPAPTPEPAPEGRSQPRTFLAGKAMIHVRKLARDIGIRFEGSAKEREAGDYILKRLRGLGYDPEIQEVPLPNGTSTRNFIVVLKGHTRKQVVLAAHYDSKKSTPGANDNASGVGVLLELARDYEGVTPYPTVVLAFVGAEEIIGSDGSQHHFGARHYARSLSKDEMGRIAAMISVDMVGYGSRLCWRNRRIGPQSITNEMMDLARKEGIPTDFLFDRGSTGWSDHEPFEDAGVPSVWMQWQKDPTYHGMGDTASHVQKDRIKKSGVLLSKWIWSLDRKSVNRLLDTSEAR